MNCEVWQSQDLPFCRENCCNLGFLFFFRICCFAAGFPGTQSRGRWTENWDSWSLRGECWRRSRWSECSWVWWQHKMISPADCDDGIGATLRWSSWRSQREYNLPDKDRPRPTNINQSAGAAGTKKACCTGSCCSGAHCTAFLSFGGSLMSYYLYLPAISLFLLVEWHKLCEDNVLSPFAFCRMVTARNSEREVYSDPACQKHFFTARKDVGLMRDTNCIDQKLKIQRWYRL